LIPVTPRHPNERDRVAALRELAVLDTPEEEAFDGIAQLAARFLNVPIAAISFVDHNRQWLKAAVGIDHRERSREHSFCAWTILDTRPLIVPDAHRDKRFRDNPCVTERQMRFYAGVPLITRSGHAVGALCVMDRTPRTLSEDQTVLLSELARVVMDRLELRRSTEQLADIRADLCASRDRLQLLALVAAHTDNAVIITDAAGRMEWVNDGFTRMTGFTFDEAMGRTPGSMLQGAETDPQTVEYMRRCLRRGEGFQVEIVNYSRDGRKYWVAAEVQPVTDDHGAVRHFVAIERDITARKRTEESLALGNDRFLLLCRATQDTVWDLNMATGEVWWNDALRKNFGWSHVTVQNDVQWWLDRIHPEDRPRVCAKFHAAAEGNALTWTDEYRFRHIDGSYRDILDRASIVRDTNGLAMRMVGIMSDLTEARKSEAILRQHKLVVEDSNVVLFRWRPAPGWPVELVSQNVEQFGYDPEELLEEQRLFAEIVHPDDLQRLGEEVTQYTQQGVDRFEQEYRIVCRDGNTRWVYDRTVVDRDEAGKVVSLYGIILDITDRKLAEEKASEYSVMLHQTNAIAQVGGWEMDPKTSIVRWSDEVYRIHEIDPGTTIDLETGVNFYDGPARNTIREAVQECLKNGTPYDLSLPMITAKGRCIQVRTQGQPVYEDGRIVRVRGAFQDITEHWAARQELARRAAMMEELHRAAEAASHAKSEFLANMSHEIRTPLTAILGYAELLSEDQTFRTNPQSGREAATSIVAAGRHLMTVINDILDLSKIEAGQMTVDCHDTDLPRLLQDVKELMSVHAAGKGIGLSVHLSTPVPRTVHTDGTRLRQILLNLTGNAIKFTELGNVTITAGVTGDGPQQLLRIGITDTGAGIAPDQIGRLFRPFSQIDSSTSRRHGGSGLGLAISRRLAELMGGDIHIAWTEPGKGSCFELELPVTVAAGTPTVTELCPVEETVPTAPAPAPTLNGRILLAEDGPDNRRLIAHHLRRAGAVVEIAENGAIALQMITHAEAEGRPFDLLVTDIQMPEMDGYALARTLRQQNSALPIIALTAHAMSDDRERCIAAGCDDYASKPVDRETLFAICRRLLNGRPMRLSHRR